MRATHAINNIYKLISFFEIINIYNLVDDYPLHMAHFVRKLVSFMENVMELFNRLVCTGDELDMLVRVVCTC